MPKNTTFSLGNIALIDKIDSETNFFESVLGGIGGRSRSFIPSVKLLISNKLNQSVSINKILEFTPEELLTTLGFENKASDQHQNALKFFQNMDIDVKLLNNKDFLCPFSCAAVSKKLIQVIH